MITADVGEAIAKWLSLYTGGTTRRDYVVFAKVGPEGTTYSVGPVGKRYRVTRKTKRAARARCAEILNARSGK